MAAKVELQNFLVVLIVGKGLVLVVLVVVVAMLDEAAVLAVGVVVVLVVLISCTYCPSVKEKQYKDDYKLVEDGRTHRQTDQWTDGHCHI